MANAFVAITAMPTSFELQKVRRPLLGQLSCPVFLIY
jgi:hypothetical protein